MSQKKDNLRAERRAHRVRTEVKRSFLPRVTVFRSLKYTYAQLIDDASQRTLVSCSSKEVTVAGDKKAAARAVGKELAKRAKEQGVTAAVFDRGSYRYHGRVKEVAEGLREGSLQI